MDDSEPSNNEKQQEVHLEKQNEHEAKQEMEQQNEQRNEQQSEQESEHESEESEQRSEASENASRSESPDGPPAPDPYPDPAEQREVHLGVRYFNFRGFVNRVQGDEWDHTIECLMIKSGLREDIDEERIRRVRLNDVDRLTLAVHSPSAPPMIAESSDGIGENRHLYRVRVRSSEVLRHLSELSGWSSDLDPAPRNELVFCRPFHGMAFYHERMKERLEKLEKDHGTSDDHKNETTSAPDSGHASRATTPDAERKPGSQTTGLEEMRCFIAFVEEKILPLWRQFDEATEATPKKVCYEEIPFLFRPGALAYVPSSHRTTRAHHQSAIQNVFRMYFCAPLDVWYYYNEGQGWTVPSDKHTKWHLYCLDHDGDGFRTAWHSVTFKYFSGERDITSLECYPLHFHSQRDQILQQQIEKGHTFKDLACGGIKHLYYSGWNLVTGVFEEEVPKFDEAEHMESEVIVDVKEAERHVSEVSIRDVPEPTSDWKHWFTYQDHLGLRVWDRPEEEDEDAMYSTTVDTLLIREDFTYFQEAKEFNEENAWIQKDGRRLYGYVLRERKFARLDIQNFTSRSDGDQTTLDDIQIKEGHKKIIRSSVSSHFLRSIEQKNHSIPTYSPDIIRGKGRGLVILLHGAPGVGKTATAEAVALEFKKPLFPITCGDLGTTPEAVESTLKDVFRYAHLWDCILLLDEADVFLTQRDRINVERNALVSVFLRVLEYYSGILFLTTNRVGALDEAFRSRVHISLYYPHLSHDDTVAILRSNLKRLPRADLLPEDATVGSAHIQVMDDQIVDFVKTEFQEYHRAHKRGPWNGRQIRNAVQIATCLAFYEKQNSTKSKNLPAVLTADHFRTVQDTITEFDRYLAKAQRADDSKMALMEGVRYDHWEEDSSPRELTQYESFTGYGADHRITKRTGGRGAVPPASRRATQGPPAGPSGGKYTAIPPGRSQGSYYGDSPSYGDSHLDDDEMYPRGSFGRLNPSDPVPRQRRPPRQPIMHMEDPEDIYADEAEPPQEWTDEYEQHSVRVDLDAQRSKGFRNTRRDQSLDRAGNIPVSDEGYSKLGYQRQGHRPMQAPLDRDR
ncbi:hypothetical protein BDV25DRAFT_139371 [Aspergillus avenaceus]|uniref:AAA+ ATPase domain-containing protein n=1 Tax=Aspergillus avenaceus TaxID=36643 RepID=A0A5N6TX24_ASPAV|nr:hypothetical protein BDV25DRAFT_139371 [Aspergillus avenaceus]